MLDMAKYEGGRLSPPHRGAHQGSREGCGHVFAYKPKSIRWEFEEFEEGRLEWHMTGIERGGQRIGPGSSHEHALPLS